jgi:hypothetical protein
VANISSVPLGFVSPGDNTKKKPQFEINYVETKKHYSYFFDGKSSCTDILNWGTTLIFTCFSSVCFLDESVIVCSFLNRWNETAFENENGITLFERSSHLSSFSLCSRMSEKCQRWLLCSWAHSSLDSRWIFSNRLQNVINSIIHSIY